VVITTDLTISGKAAQFGRGVLADVSTNLIGQFARNLEADLLGGPPAAGQRPRHAARAAAAASDAGDSVDLLKVVAVPMAKRYAPAHRRVAAGVAVGFLLGRRKRATPPRTSPTSCRRAWPGAVELMKAAAFAYHRPTPSPRRCRCWRVRRRRQDPRRRTEPGADARDAADVLREPDRHLARR
jgi:hypothetical protein